MTATMQPESRVEFLASKTALASDWSRSAKAEIQRWVTADTGAGILERLLYNKLTFGLKNDIQIAEDGTISQTCQLLT